MNDPEATRTFWYNASMSKQTERPDPKTADYQSKDSLVAQLSDGGPSIVGSALLGLGTAFETNPLLSIKQKEKFLTTLKSNGLLEYQTSYLSPVLEAAEIGNPDDILGKVDETLDTVAWNIEKDADLQVKTVVAAKQLSEVHPHSTEAVTIAANLFNEAHLATRKEAHSRSLSDVEFGISFSRYDKVEQAVFENRAQLGSKLKELGLATDEEIDDLGSFDFGEYKALRGYSELFDRLIALHFVQGFVATDTVGRFKELQEVLHAGYSLGIRDAMEANEKLYSDDII